VNVACGLVGLALSNTHPSLAERRRARPLRIAIGTMTPAVTTRCRKQPRFWERGPRGADLKDKAADRAAKFGLVEKL
jgi:hypothetical protein